MLVVTVASLHVTIRIREALSEPGCMAAWKVKLKLCECFTQNYETLTRIVGKLDDSEDSEVVSALCILELVC